MKTKALLLTAVIALAINVCSLRADENTATPEETNLSDLPDQVIFDNALRDAIGQGQYLMHIDVRPIGEEIQKLYHKQGILTLNEQRRFILLSGRWLTLVDNQDEAIDKINELFLQKANGNPSFKKALTMCSQAGKKIRNVYKTSPSNLFPSVFQEDAQQAETECYKAIQELLQS